MKDEEVLQLISEYNSGNISFGEILLASGFTIKQICRLIKNEGISISINVGFQEKGKGLSEEELKMILDGM